MHEFSIATQIVESVREFADVHQADKVLKVRLKIGELTCVAGEQLRFCYQSITHGTVMEDSVLEIEPISAAVQCPNCRYQGPPKYWNDALVATDVPTLQCPHCGQAAEATEGHECEIKSVQFVNSTAATTSV